LQDFHYLALVTGVLNVDERFHDPLRQITMISGEMTLESFWEQIAVA
jgi:hypothetical protein